MLGEKIRRHGPKGWLINTGWTAGPYGVGHRIAIPHTRAMIRAVLENQVPEDGMTPHPVFGISVPGSVPGVPDAVLDPRGTWVDPAEYDRQAAMLAGMFRDNFKRYGDEVSDEIRSAAPRT
jgi:phosphoenolpyruvate carboxykinase (ATP)